MTSKSLTTGIAAAALVATIGLAYAQTSTSESAQPTSPSGPDKAQLEQTTPPSSTTTTITPSAPAAPADSSTPSSTTTTTTTTTPEPSSTTTVTPPASDAPAMAEPAPRADRN